MHSNLVIPYLSFMKQLLSPFALVLSLSTWAQKEIQLEELSGHIGDSITVKANIYGVRYLETAKNTPTFINVGAAYPNQLLTIVIWGNVRQGLGYAPEEKPQNNGMAVVSGKVELYRGKPQIVITDPKQLRILYDEVVPASQVPQIQQQKK